MKHLHTVPANSSPYRQDQRESQARGHSRQFDAVFVKAQGGMLVDEEGRRFIDFISGHGSLNYGHNDPDLVDALVDHVRAHRMSAGPDMHSPAKQRFLKTFCGRILAPRGMSHRLQFTGPGPDDAMHAALALARKITGRPSVIAFTHSHTGAAHGLFETAWRHPYDDEPGIGAGSADHLAAMLDDPTSGVSLPAAIVLECVQADSSLRAASARWVRDIAALARRRDILLVVDDRVTGGGRCGGFFSFEGLGVMPDLVVPTLSLSGLGLPLGLLLVRPDRDQWSAGEWSSVFQHNHHAFAAAAQACEKFWSDGRLSNTVGQRAALLIAGLQGIAQLLPADGPLPRVVGRGLMQGLRLPSADVAQDVVARCFRRGLLVAACGGDPRMLRLMPALTMPTLLLEQAMATLYRCVADATGQKARSAPHRALAALHAAARRAAQPKVVSGA